MDWKLLLTSFTTIFLAEMGDKTQIAAFTMTSSSHRPWTVFLGASMGLVLVTAFGVWLGNTVGKFLPEEILKKSAAVLFVALGIWTWFKG